MEFKDLPPNVQSYLESTRFLIPNEEDSQLQEVKNNLYTPLCNYLKQVSDSYDISLQFGVVYSDTLKSETIIVNKQKYIIHDQYLGQVLNMLNRLFLYECSIQSKEIYSHKLLSQIFSRYGFYEESVFSANIYNNFKNEIDSNGKLGNKKSNLHSLFTVIQELFIILHELSHIIFSERNDMLDTIRNEVKEWVIKYQYDALKKPTNYDQYIPDELTHIEKVEYLTALKKDRGISIQNIDEVYNNNNLLEEFCCDRLAMLNLLPYLEQIDMELNFYPIVLCLLHMRSLQSIETICSLEENLKLEDRKTISDSRKSVLSTFNQMRVHHIKDYSYKIFNISGDYYSETHSLIATSMNNHTDEINTPLYKILNCILYSREFRDLNKEGFDKAKYINESSLITKRLVSAIFHQIELS